MSFVAIAGGSLPGVCGRVRRKDHAHGSPRLGVRVDLDAAVQHPDAFVELAEGVGDAPAAGTEIEQGDRRFQVVRVAPSPLPGDDRICAYLQPV